MTDTTRAQHSLSEEVGERVDQILNDAPGPRPRILWWDAGGHLRTVIQRVCREMEISFVEQDHPLQFRTWVAEQGRKPSDEPSRVVWYIPQAKHGRDWFRDVEALGAVIEQSIEEVAADLYDIQSWQLRPWSEDGAVSESVAGVLSDELGGGSRPTLKQLQLRILTGDDSRPVEYLLRNGWGELPRSSEVVKKIRGLLDDEYVPHLEPDDSPEEIVRKVRRWAVAGWLQRAGVDRGRFPEPIAASRLDYAFRRLKGVLETDPQSNALTTFQAEYWPDVVDAVDEPWKLATCPVDGALEERLWEEWLDDLENGAYDTCRERAEARTEALRQHTSRLQEDVSKTSPSWIRAWRQATSLAFLSHRYETWEDRDAPVHALYADQENGSWHIDAAVRRIIVSGTPEEALPDDHPAQAALAQHREHLVSEAYLEYLRALGEKMKRGLAQGRVTNDDFQSAVTFWSDHEENLDTGNEAVVFYLDALRLDLARELSDRLQTRSDSSDEVDLSVDESTYLGTLPSETKFGMGAVLPGRTRAFEVRLDDNGTLQAFRNGRTLNKTQRSKLLRQEGWTVAPDDQNAWTHSRVAYVDTELDDIGENDLQAIEAKLAQRIDELADLIFKTIRQGDWNRAYVVTDHGFVLLPPDTGIEPVSPPDGEVKRRRVAAEDLSEDGPGILLHREQIPDLSYLASPVRLLVDPQQRFEKRGLSDARYYHGGALPQECVLSFLAIEAA